MALHVLTIIVSCRAIAVKTILFSVFYYYAMLCYNRIFFVNEPLTKRTATFPAHTVLHLIYQILFISYFVNYAN